jgi:cell wall assembly regulator SMI1
MALSIDEIKLMIPELLRQARRPEDAEAPEYEPGPATLEDIRRFETEKGMSLSRDVIEWLMTTNGIKRGPAGLNGISGWMAIGMEGAFTEFPEWKFRNWFPLAGDGFGNCYVSYPIDRCPDRRPVCFVDVSVDPHRVAYVVASSVWHFLYFHLKEDMGDKRWPCNRDYVLEQDPTIQDFTELPMPWAAGSGLT